METTNSSRTQWVTAEGDHFHDSYECAEARVRVRSEAFPAMYDTAARLPACTVCCDTATVAAATTAQAAAQAEMCANTGVTHPKRLNSKCRDCEKVGKVDRRTGTLRAHKPQAV